MTATARTAAVLCKQVRDHRDQAAFAELVKRNLVAIRLTVREFRWAQDTYGLESDELTQECLLAFWEAACNFKDTWQATYTTVAKAYARTRLKNAVRVQQQTKYRVQHEALHLDEPIAENSETSSPRRITGSPK